MPFEIETVAFTFAVGAILSQQSHPIALFSKQSFPKNAKGTLQEKALLPTEIFPRNSFRKKYLNFRRNFSKDYISSESINYERKFTCRYRSVESLIPFQQIFSTTNTTILEKPFLFIAFFLQMK